MDASASSSPKLALAHALLDDAMILEELTSLLGSMTLSLEAMGVTIKFSEQMKEQFFERVFLPSRTLVREHVVEDIQACVLGDLNLTECQFVLDDLSNADASLPEGVRRRLIKYITTLPDRYMPDVAKFIADNNLHVK